MEVSEAEGLSRERRGLKIFCPAPLETMPAPMSAAIYPFLNSRSQKGGWFYLLNIKDYEKNRAFSFLFSSIRQNIEKKLALG